MWRIPGVERRERIANGGLQGMLLAHMHVATNDGSAGGRAVFRPTSPSPASNPERRGNTKFHPTDRPDPTTRRTDGPRDCHTSIDPPPSAAPRARCASDRRAVSARRRPREREADARKAAVADAADAARACRRLPCTRARPAPPLPAEPARR